MTPDARQAIVQELAAAFGGAEDVSPDAQQPLHVRLTGLQFMAPWHPSPAEALLRFGGWPDVRPDFWIDPAVVNASGQPPRNPTDEYILGRVWRRFSFGFPWPAEPRTATRAVQLWLTRFREPT